MERIRAIAMDWADRMAPYVEDDNNWYRLREMDGKDAAALGEEMLEILAVLDALRAEPTEAEIDWDLLARIVAYTEMRWRICFTDDIALAVELAEPAVELLSTMTSENLASIAGIIAARQVGR